MNPRTGERNTSPKLRLLEAVAQTSERWTDRAACKGQNPDLFFADQGRFDVAANAKRVCATCTTVRECLDYAIRTETWHGVWGGMTPDERRRHARTRRARP